MSDYLESQGTPLAPPLPQPNPQPLPFRSSLCVYLSVPSSPTLLTLHLYPSLLRALSDYCLNLLRSLSPPLRPWPFRSPSRSASDLRPALLLGPPINNLANPNPDHHCQSGTRTTLNEQTVGLRRTLSFHLRLILRPGWPTLARLQSATAKREWQPTRITNNQSQTHPSTITSCQTCLDTTHSNQLSSNTLTSTVEEGESITAILI